MRFSLEQLEAAAAALRPLGLTRPEATQVLRQRFGPLLQALAQADGPCPVCGLLASYSQVALERSFETHYQQQWAWGPETYALDWKAGRICRIEPGLPHHHVWHPHTKDEQRWNGAYKRPLCELAVEGLVRMVVGRPIIGLVACSASKSLEPSPAHDLYQGQLFKLSRAYAERWCHGWNILSARWHMLTPDQVIEPYDERIGRTEDARYQWDLSIAIDAMQKFNDCQLVVLGGQDYTRWSRRLAEFPFVRPHVRFTVVTPLAGLGIGQMKQHLARGLRRHAE